MIIPTSGKIEKPKTHLLWEDKIFSNVKKIKKFYFVLDLKVYTGSVQLLLILIDSDKVWSKNSNETFVQVARRIIERIVARDMKREKLTLRI